MHIPTTIKALLLMLATALTGCASPALDLGQQLAEQANREQLELPVLPNELTADTSAAVKTLLQQPLDFQSVAQLAVLNNPDFLAAMAALQVSQADLAQAGLLPNPGLKISRARSEEGYETELEFGFDLFALLFRNQQLAIAEHQANQQQYQLAEQLVALIAQSRLALADAVTAQQQYAYLLQVQDAIDASAELANRMYQVGNYSALQQARAQKYAAEVKLQLAQAQQRQIQSLEALYRQLGLWGSDLILQLPEQLPALPEDFATNPNAEQLAISQRLDLQQARANLAAMAAQLELTQSSRFLRGLDAELSGSAQHSESRSLTLGFELPLFDRHRARLSKAQAQLQQQFYLAQAKAVNARSEVRLNQAMLAQQYHIALHYQQQLLPLAKRINQENVLRYNGMLIGVFELIADTQAQVDTITAAMQALNNFHQARIRFEQSLWGAAAPTSSAQPEASSAAAPAGH
ncbi:TolC family protein [Rheinheimera sp.]|uniref:TolC family protein n=1 Tax=Rheinheimera sp. TaxID=1869214 RepID=UPI003AF62FD5